MHKAVNVILLWEHAHKKHKNAGLSIYHVANLKRVPVECALLRGFSSVNLPQFMAMQTYWTVLFIASITKGAAHAL
jgi:hypothetical protein